MKARLTRDWPADSVFTTCDEASHFFASGSLAIRHARAGAFHGLELSCKSWHADALAVEEVRSSYFDDRAIFPDGTIQFDNALLMREIQHEWIGRPDLCCAANGRSAIDEAQSSANLRRSRMSNLSQAPGLATPRTRTHVADL